MPLRRGRDFLIQKEAFDDPDHRRPAFNSVANQLNLVLYLGGRTRSQAAAFVLNDVTFGEMARLGVQVFQRLLGFDHTDDLRAPD
jgi:hypothetical protein